MEHAVLPCVLHLPEYRQALRLDEPFVVSPGAAPNVVNLVDAIAPGFPDRSRRGLVRLLTQRPPDPFPPDVLEDLDRLFATEAARRPRVSVDSLPPLSGVGPLASCSLWQGDLTTLAADAIVNAANSALLGCFRPFHACVDNAIHSVAGPRLREDCAAIRVMQGSEETVGNAKLTRGYHLPARYVLHTVGPALAAGALPSAADARGLAECYRACLEVAAHVERIRSVAFCSISTGVFGFPVGPAARIALATVTQWIQEHPGRMDRVVFDVYSPADARTYRDALAHPEEWQP